jgi:alpha-1,2-mannosyltransferase
MCFGARVLAFYSLLSVTVKGLRLGVRRFAAIAWVLFCAGWYVDRTVLRLIASLAQFSDFSFYHRAGQAILAGKTPYVDPAFMYPPVLGFLSAPLALTDYLTARWIWFLFSHVCLLASAWLVWSRLGRTLCAASVVAPIWAFGGAASESLGLGQVGSLLTLSLALTYCSDRFRGVAAGFGFALKYIPGVCLLYFVLNREWRTLIKFAATAGLALIVPWLVLAVGFRGPLTTTSPDYLMGTPALLSWSLPATLLRTLDFPSTGDAVPHDWEFGNVTTNLHLPTSRRWLSVADSVGVLALGSLLFWLSVRRGQMTETALLLGGLISLGLAASPVCWSHYQMMQYPGVALLVGRAVQARRWRVAGSALVLFAFCYAVPVEFLYRHYVAVGGWGNASASVVYVWTAIPPLASLGLFGLFLLFRPQADPFTECQATRP